jgi:dGTPase
VEKTIRELLEEREAGFLSEKATFSRNAQRTTHEQESDVRTAFQKDRDRIIHSKAFRRMMHKTQVFFAPEGDHYRTRMTHTLEVAQVARTIARGLSLNEDLAEAMALGHDLGHTPFAHTGEEMLDQLVPGGFEHNHQSIRVVEVIEPMNLTAEVRDGILNHRTRCSPKSLEGQIVRLSDKIAYLNHDIDDAIRAGVLEIQQIPKDCLDILGYSHSDRIGNMVTDVITTSWERSQVEMSPIFAEATRELRQYMFRNVYLAPPVKKEEDKAKGIVAKLYEYFLKHPDVLGKHLNVSVDPEHAQQHTVDYIAGMTDRYAIYTYEHLFVPKSWSLNRSGG